MTQIIDIVLPVFGLIAIGYLVAWFGLLGRVAGEGLVDFVFVIAIPLLIFRTIATADFGGVSPWRIWLPFFAAFALNWAIGDLLIRRVFRRDARAGLVAGVSAAYGNTVLVGIPLVIAAYGDQGAAAITLIIAVHLPVMMTAGAVLIGRAERQDGVSEEAVTAAAAARNVAANLLKNPIIIGLLLGVVWRVFDLPLGGVPKALVDRLADVAATLALFAMGMGLRKYGIRRNVPAGLALSASEARPYAGRSSGAGPLCRADAAGLGQGGRGRSRLPDRRQCLSACGAIPDRRSAWPPTRSPSPLGLRW